MTLFARYFHTLRHLRPVQIYGRLWFRLYRPRPDSRPAPPLCVAAGAWVAPPAGEPRLLGPVTFRFLDETRTLADPGDWNRPSWDKLWLYNLHYFDDLNAEGAGVRREWQRALIARWIADNPPGHGNGWEPYPLSLRVVNWIQWLLAGHAPQPDWLDSLAMQARYLARRLEWHLLGNHLFANAKALVHVGLFFDGSEADSWLAAGLRVLGRQLPEQILPDGGHFERSPMYHAILLKDVLDLLNLARVYPGRIGASQTAQWRDAASRMLDWLRAMTHPDGGLAFFNDAAFGIAPAPEELEAYARRLGLGPRVVPSDGLHHLASSGYVRLQNQDAVAILDVGEIGPTYLPGHAHADSLSFELSLGGRRFVVNSGTSLYDDCEERLRQRSTAAHSTVVVDGADSSEVWHSFRVARRALP
ncbi:MAG: heparinase II/III family protein, partial [Caldilineaceae bacterium]|nr:heparinase II/III family protein [Caldilineaceae bacterium]